MRIGFLFNHDQVHQVAHGLPIALSLAQLTTGDDIIVCSTNARISQEIRLLAGPSLGRDFQFVELGLNSVATRAFDALAGALVPSTKLLVYRDNLDFFKSLDILVVPEKTSLVLKTRFGLEDLTIIHTRHGAGDRAIGFDAASARFDHILASGAKVRDRLVRDAGVPPDKISIVGYPKFDLFEARLAERPTGDRVTIVYNPHVAPHLSSWYRMGPKLLEWFARNPRYQLIFAPHIMLFERRLAFTIQPPRVARVSRVPAALAQANNISIDLHSRALTTMEYLNRADIYVGDASSQAYEFMFRPRPCIFLNPNGLEWKGNSDFAHWSAGPVVADLAGFEQALDDAFDAHRERYAKVQDELLRYTFDLDDTPSSARAAQAILEVAAARSLPKKARTASAARSEAPRQSFPSAA